MTEQASTTVNLPRILETPPRTTGNAQADIPILVDWLYSAYQTITESVAYINSQIERSDVNLASLPDPNATTLATAQQTANDAYNLAAQNSGIFNNMPSGEFTLSDTSASDTITFDEEQPDTDFHVLIQAKSNTGTPAADSYVVKEKTYSKTQFTVTMVAAPATGNSVTYEWQLVRNT